MRLTLIRLELLASTILLGLAGAWSALRGVELGSVLEPALSPTLIGISCGLGLAATIPLMTAPWARRVLVLRGLNRAWNWLEAGLGHGLRLSEILVLAFCSAISEEIFFRGVLQQEVGILTASALFGCLHPLGTAYVLWAATAGAGLGVLFAATGNLLAPIAAHGTYNLVALLYLRRRAAR
jgi:membrane protease YdiL (CAAX protease family)